MLLILFQFWAANQDGGGVGSVDLMLAALILAGVVIQYAHHMTTVIELSNTELVIHSALAITKRVPRSEIGGIELRQLSAFPGALTIAVIHDVAGRCIRTLPEAIWSADDIERLQHRLGARDRIAKLVTRAELRREFPGVGHNYLGWLLAGAVMIVILGGAYLQNR